MIHSVRFIAVLDTNVLHPVIIRDILFWLAYYDLYRPAWSGHIFEEWEKLIRRKNPTFDDLEVTKRLKKADEAFPFARVENYENLIDGLTLNDTNDRHVLAAAIKINSNVIVTQNLKDFPSDYLSQFNLDAKHLMILFVTSLIWILKLHFRLLKKWFFIKETQTLTNFRFWINYEMLD